MDRMYALRQLPAFSGFAADRAAVHRDDQEWLDAAWRDPATSVIVVADGKVVVVDGSVDVTKPADAPEGERYLLGVDGGGAAYFAVHVPGSHPDSRAVSLRQASLVLDDHDGSLLVHAVGLANWHETHTHCSRCGTPTVVASAGHVRRCPDDGSEHYPRTDPVVIVLVTDEHDRALLGNHVDWPASRYSTLAGFVEPGETPEQAVAREVREESGVVVTSCRYAGSQPWPFPSSLMLGFYGSVRGETPSPDRAEMSDVRWFSRDDLAVAVERGEIIVPPSVAISRRLIEGWYGDALPTSGTPTWR